MPPVGWRRHVVFPDVSPWKNKWNKNDAQENREENIGGNSVDAVREP
jgi:hypothetical protein